MTAEEIKNLRRKLKKARDNGKLQEISDCCCNLAAYLSEEEEHEEALNLYKESLNACEAMGNKEGVALANRMITEECINLGYFDDALKHVTLFLNYAKDEGDKAEEQRGLVLKGHVYFTQAEYLMDIKPKEKKTVEELLEQSMEAYRKSFAICNTELNNISEKERLQMKARLLQNKSLVLSRQNKLEYAQAHLIRAIKICTKEKLNDTEHLCYLSLGDLYIKKGEPEKALHVYNRAFELSHSSQKKRDSLVGKAKTYIIMENYQQAKSMLKKAYKIKNDNEIQQLLKQVATVIRLENNLCSIPDTELNARKDVFKKLGDIYCTLKNYKKGIKCYMNMLNCAQKAGLSKNDLTKCYTLLCRAFTQDKQYDKALFYSHQEAESLSKWAPDKVYKTYLRIGKLHELNNSDFEEIHFAYSRAKSKALQFENPKLQIKCLNNLIRIGKSFNKTDLIQEYEKELQNLKNKDNDSGSSCNSDIDTEFDISSDSEEEESDYSSDTNIKDLISDSDQEKEEYDRPKERCKRTKFTIKRNEKGETDLHVAAIKGNYKRVKLLLDQGHPVNVRDTAGWTPLHEACNHGYADIVNILLDFGANINDKGGPSCDGTTPLHDAATNGQFEVINSLIKRGASTLVLNDAGETPLQCLLAWKKKSALDAEEDAIFHNIVEALKSPLDSEDIKRHIKANKSFVDKKTAYPITKKTPSMTEISGPDYRKSLMGPKATSAVSEYKETIELLRRKRQAHDKNSNTDSESSEDSCDGFRYRKKKSASEEYRKTIAELRHRSQKIKEVSEKAKPKPALIDEREYVENCIMEDDGDETEEEMKAEDIFEDCEKIEDLPPRKRLKSSQCIPKKPTLEEEFKVKPWLKSIPLDLLEDDFEVSPKETKFNRIDSDDEILTQINLPGEKVSLTADITVKINNEKKTISVAKSDIANLKVNWLIQEIAKEHPVVQNPDYFMHLRLDQNQTIEESVELEQVINKEVEFVLAKWKSLPLSERYEKVCSVSSHPDVTLEVRPLGFKHRPHPQVLEILKKTSSTRCLTLSNLKLSALTLIPICKTVKYESFLQTLNLSNNYFGDKGVELIVKVFETCIIEELNISKCNVTSSGVYHFSDALGKINELSKNGLEVLNLSGNPITDDAVLAIKNIVDQLPNLRILKIENCELETTIEINAPTSLVIVQGFFKTECES